MIKTKVAFLEGRLLSSQSELFDYFFNCSNWLDKSRPSKKSHFCFYHVNWLTVIHIISFGVITSGHSNEFSNAEIHARILRWNAVIQCGGDYVKRTVNFNFFNLTKNREKLTLETFWSPIFQLAFAEKF